jgi:hypothetical protein
LKTADYHWIGFLFWIRGEECIAIVGNITNIGEGNMLQHLIHNTPGLEKQRTCSKLHAVGAGIPASNLMYGALEST